MFLTRISIANPVFATMMMVALLVFGLFSFQRLGIDQYPDVDMPVVVVVTSYPGASPETVEVEVTRKVEEALNTISGLDKLTSTTSEGRSVVVAQFALEVAGADAAQDVRDRVAPLEARFPDGVDKPRVQRFNPADQPILSVAISSTRLDRAELTSLADRRISKELATIPGVGDASIVGGQSKQVRIEVDESRMTALGVGVDEILTALNSQNQNVPAGNIATAQTDSTIQVQGRVEHPEGFLDVIVARRGGSPVYLKDVAAVRYDAADATSHAAYNGETALAINVLKVQGSNTVAVAEAVKAKVAALDEEYSRQGVRLSIVTDNSVAIEESVEQVQSTLIEGAALAVAIVFLFLNSWRSTVITGLTLPISMIGTLAVIAFFGFTLNTMSLLALTLSIGILIDDAIVVRENITRHLHMGKTHRQAALDGTDEIGLAVAATTATIVAVFLPVAFMEGIVGRFFYQFGVTVAAAVLISLFVSFTLDPMLSSVWYDPAARHDAKRGSIGRAVAKFDQAFEGMIAVYRGVIRWTLKHRLVTLVATVALFAGSVMMVPLVGAEFVPSADEGRISVSVTAPVGASLEYSAAKVAQVEHALREFPEVKATYSTINSGRAAGKNKATIQVQLVPASERKVSQSAVSRRMRERLASIGGVEATIGGQGFGGGSSPLQVSIIGDERAVLDRIAAKVAETMRAIPGAVDVTTSEETPSTVVAVKLKREAASDLGVGVQQLGTVLNAFIGGQSVTDWTDDEGQTYSVVVRLPEDHRSDLEAISSLRIATGRTDDSGAPVMVRLDQVAEFGLAASPAEIRRLDLKREVLVSGDVSGRTLGDVTDDIKAAIEKMDVPPGYTVKFGGQSQNMAETTGHMATALLMAVIFIYIVLASQFGSFAQPIAIMVALPLSLIGVLLGLLVAGSTINMFSLIGFIMLMGLVTKNGILLVDFVNRERKRGLSLEEALVSAGTIRFRPIVMTTLAMIVGMLPLALAMSGGGAQRAPMAHAVIGGLISSTVLTLLVVPVILSYIDSITRRISPWLPKAPDDDARHS